MIGIRLWWGAVLEETMRKSFAFLPILAIAVLGCSEKVGETGDTGGDTDTDTDVEVGDLEVEVTWTDDGAVPEDTDGDSLPDVGCGDSVSISITDPDGEANWDFGMAETGSGNGWFGEDCFEGYASFNHCHAIGVNASLDEVTDCGAASVVAGTSTLLDAAKDPFLTYYLADSLGSCFVWGHDVAYYGPLACTEMTP